MASVPDEAITSPPRRHVLVVTFPAFGHIIPILELAKKMSQFHDVTFAVSAAKVLELTKRELIEDGDLIEIYGIPDGVEDDFDNPADPTALKRIFEAVLPAVGKLLTEVPTGHDLGTPSPRGITKPVDIVIVDNFLGGPASVCSRRGIPYYLFNSANAVMAQLILTIRDDSPTVPDEEAEPFSRMPEPGGPPLPLPEKMKQLLLPLRNTIHLASGIIVNSLRDFELDALREVEKNPSMDGLTVHCVGPLLPAEKGKNATKLATEKKVGDWLDRQQVNSVAYVSFGSIATPTPEQVKIIGQALLALGHPVIWSIRDKYHQFFPDEIASGIASQFTESDGKFLVIPWAPQKMILGHSAVAVFLSHCGWNSTLEGLSAGTPTVCWPMFADQLMNSQWLVKLGAGLLIEGTGIRQARLVPAEEIEEVIGKVAGWNEQNDGTTSTYQKAARTGKDKINESWTANGSSHKELMDLMAFRQKK